MSHVLVLDAGGTISSQADARGVLSGGQGLALGAGAGDTRLSLQQVHAGLSDELSLADAAAIVRAALGSACEPPIRWFARDGRPIGPTTRIRDAA